MVEIQMIGDGRRRAAFEPAALTVTPGATLRFINVSGGPHNVVFWPDSVPPGAADLLDAAMPNRMARLSGPLATQPNEAYEIPVPPTAPPGRYRAYCLPHLAMGMTIAITVR
jgi:plastocyanin